MATHDMAPTEALRARVISERLEALGARTNEEFHERVAEHIELALGQAMPQLEVRFQSLSISADLVSLHRHPAQDAEDDAELETEEDLPTIPNHIRQRVAKYARKKNHMKKPILDQISGCFKPGTLTLILGQSGSGKSALMKLLSGRFPLGKGVSTEGSVHYNGVDRSDLLPTLPQLVAYVNQTDKHFPTLTVKETLEFAHECCGAALSERAEQHLTNGTPEENEQAIELLRSVFRHYPEIVLKELGLERCADTNVGDAMLRGISGGERRRLTTGEMEFGTKYVTLMDEISTGLDSAAAYDIIKAHRSLAKRLRRTVVMTLLQPSPEVFALFDNVMLLNQGQLLYFGPCSDVEAYFEDLGFVCPAGKDIADFLCDLATPQQVQYELNESPVGLGHHPRSAFEFAELFRSSKAHQVLMADLAKPVDPALVEDVEKHMVTVPAFFQSRLASLQTLLTRQIRLTVRNHAFMMGRAFMVVLIGLLFSSVFRDFDPRDIQVVMGILFASVMFLALGQAAMLPTFFAAREIFYKQRGANFFRTSTYVLANSLAQIPFTVVESLVFGSLVYWLCGFVSKVSLFLLFEVLLILTNMTFSAWYFFLAAVSPNLHIAKPMTMVSLLLYVLFAGFVQTRNQIPSYLTWIYWVDPVSWALRALAVSQYRDDAFNRCIHDSDPNLDYCQMFGMNMGEFYLSRFDVESGEEWVGLGVLYMACAYAFFLFLSWFVLEFYRYERPEHITLPTKQAFTEPGADDYGSMETPKHANASHQPAEVTVTLSRSPRQVPPVALAFQDIRYSVPDPNHHQESLTLLNGITGYALPGKMTALMGSSGAGKTTLMDVIAGRKTGGTIEGRILLNGYPATDLAVRRSTGYCEQMDVHSESSTFREALIFSAMLRQPSDVSFEDKMDAVDECLELLNMESIADRIIRGSPAEQLKRLTIGVELVASPSVIFLDEPTSGLDARSAKVIMDGVRKVADAGRTILCTIHQPSTEVFHLFDSLLLLQRGGQVVFFGDLGHHDVELIEYMESIPGVPAIKRGVNPATWMLEVIGAGVAHASESVNFAAWYETSERRRTLRDRETEVGLFEPQNGSSPLQFSSVRASTEGAQWQLLMKRFWNLYWRTPSYNLTRWVISLFLGIVFGLVYLDAEYTTYQGINGGLGMVFLTTSFIGLVSFISVLPIASEERAAFYRERAAQTYNSFWFFLSFTVVEIPYVAVGALLFLAPFYAMVGFTGLEQWALYWLNLALHILLQAYIGQFLVFALPRVEVAAIVGVLLNAVFLLFMGFNPPAVAIPSGYTWLYDIIPGRYTFAALAAIVFGDCSASKEAQVLGSLRTMSSLPPALDSWSLGCQLLQHAPPKVGTMPLKTYLNVVYGIERDDLWQYTAYVVVAIVVFRILAALALQFINHQKR